MKTIKKKTEKTNCTVTQSDVIESVYIFAKENFVADCEKRQNEVEIFFQNGQKFKICVKEF